MGFLLSDKTYHIFNHANGFENLFRNDENKRFFLDRYEKHIVPIAETYAFCLMNNHFHLLLKIKEKEEVVRYMTSKVLNFGSRAADENKIDYFISKQFANFFSSYTQAFNKMFGRMGSLFIKNFKREEIVTEDHFRELVVYIHRNPVHHGYCSEFSEWRFSSYHCYTGVNPFDFVKTKPVLEAFCGLETLVDFHEEKLRKHIASTEMDL